MFNASGSPLPILGSFIFLAFPSGSLYFRQAFYGGSRSLRLSLLAFTWSPQAFLRLVGTWQLRGRGAPQLHIVFTRWRVMQGPRRCAFSHISAGKAPRQLAAVAYRLLASRVGHWKPPAGFVTLAPRCAGSPALFHNVHTREGGERFVGGIDPYLCHSASRIRILLALSGSLRVGYYVSAYWRRHHVPDDVCTVVLHVPRHRFLSSHLPSPTVSAVMWAVPFYQALVLASCHVHFWDGMIREVRHADLHGSTH